MDVFGAVYIDILVFKKSFLRYFSILSKYSPKKVTKCNIMSFLSSRATCFTLKSIEEKIPRKIGFWGWIGQMPPNMIVSYRILINLTYLSESVPS